MTNITKALDELETATSFSSKSARDNHAKNIADLRAALQGKAVAVAVAIDNLHNERRDGMTNAIFPPVQIGTRLFAAQPAPVVPDGWVSVGDAMPNQGALVLAYCKGDAYPDSAIWSQPKGWSFGDVTDQYWDEVQKPVTHWRPMPPIPATPKAVKRCDYPDCLKACGDATGFCHKGSAMIAASQQKGESAG